MSRVVCWVSAGIPSAIAAKLTTHNAEYADHEIVHAYCETGSEHPDNQRFLKDVEKWTGVPIIRLKSEKYKDTWEVWEHRKYIAGIDGAPCTAALKIEPRVAFQRVDDIHVFGYTEDANDMRRAASLQKHFFELDIRTPLIDRGLNRAACMSLAESAGLKRPVLYDLGYPNNNCLICPKATSPVYYALVRKTHPEQFERMVKLSRELDVRLTRLNGERAFIDEIPLDHTVMNPEVPVCDFLCHLVEMELEAVE